MVSLIQKFYEDFNDLNAEAMVSAYDSNVIFSDPAFGVLKGERASNMWRMLCASQKDKPFKVELTEVLCDNDTVTAKWEAQYLFSKTGNPVHNRITANIRIKDNKIVEHHDSFSLHRWATQALGTKGKLIGWTPFFKSQLQKQTNQMLDRFEESIG